MISFVLNLAFGLFFGCAVLILIKLNDYTKITLRGRRVIFIAAVIAGFLINLFVSNFSIDCDLRAGATTPCSIQWGQI